LEAAARRRVRSGAEYEHLFPAPTGKDTVIKKSADVADTVRFIQENVPLVAWQTEKLANQIVQGKNLEQTCSNLWHFIYRHIPYKRDKENVEQVRSPRRSWYDRNRTDENGEVGVDCDCYTTFISATLFYLGIPHKYRITKYLRVDGSEPRWQHIYVVVPKNGKLEQDLSRREDYIVLDPVKDAYDDEQPFLQNKDYNAKMKLEFLDGIETGQKMRNTGSSIDLQDMDAANFEQIGEVGNIFDKAKETIKKVAAKVAPVLHTVNRYANPLTIALRNGFLASMQLNIMNVAGRLKYGYLTDAQATKMGINLPELAKLRKILETAENTYYQAGGEKANLKKAILEGKGNKDKKVPLSGLNGLDGIYADEDEYLIVNGLGQLGEPVTAAAIGAAAAAVGAVALTLKQVKDLFKKDSPVAEDFQSEAENGAPAPGAAFVPTITTSNPTGSGVIITQGSAAPYVYNPSGQPGAPTSYTSPEDSTGADTPGNPEPKPGIFQQAGTWIKENPGKSLLIGGGIVAAGLYIKGRMNSRSGPARSRAVNGLNGVSARRKKRKGKKGKVKVRAIKIS
jgi:hypothetical protein